MKYVIYNYKTKEVACYIDEDLDIITHGDFELREYDDCICPIFNTYEEGDTFLMENEYIFDLKVRENDE